MQTWRIQPLTVMTLTALFAVLGAWTGFLALGVVMFVGAVWPSLNLMDRWVSLVSGKDQRTFLHPRRFASGMGGAMLLAGGIAGWAGAGVFALILAALTFFAASLLAVFKFCVGCWIFNSVVVPLVHRESQA